MDSAKGLPEKFVERLKVFVPYEKQEEVFQSFLSIRPVSFRVNTIKTTRKELEQHLTLQGFTLEPVSWFADAYILKNKSKEELMQTEEYIQGHIYLQNLSSMIPALVLDPTSKDTALDMAASPGSKTTQIAAMMANLGTILANDKSRQRLFKLYDVLKTQGVTNTQVINYPGEFLWRKYTNFFDKVLLDAPCSMEGRISLQDVDSYKDWSTKKIKQLSQLQKWMLRSAVACCKRGGTIVYSTCSLSPEENEEVVDWILKKEPETVTIEKIDIPHLASFPGLSSGFKKSFDSSLKQTTRIYPNAIYEGFYIAKLRKK